MEGFKLKILTVNDHASYLTMLAKTGHDFYVITKWGNREYAWGPSDPPVPANITLIEFNNEQKRKIRSGGYDLLIIHNIHDVLWFFHFFGIRTIFVAHIPLFVNTFYDIVKTLSKRFTYRLFALTHNVRFVGISEFKRKTWSILGDVIVTPPIALPPADPGKGYDRVIIVGNGIKERGVEVGYDIIQQVRQKIPLSLVGARYIEGTIWPKSRQEFEDAFRSGRIYLYAIRYPYNDGFNLAMLEAMAMGMAIVTIENPSSPIIHNYNGLVGKDAEELIGHLQNLLMNRKLVDELGRRAQETVHRQFPEKTFVNKWNHVLAELGARRSFW